MLTIHKNRVAQSEPSPEQAERMDRSQATVDWLWQRPPDELAGYRGQWIAAFDCRIVASAPSRAALKPLIAHLDRRLVVVQRIEQGWHVR